MNKKALVTGADGFIGSHLVEHLVEKGYKVRAFVYYNSFNSNGWLDSIPKKVLNEVEIVSGDIRDFKIVNMATENIEVLYHLAALISIPFSYNSPASYLETNITGTLNVLEAAKVNNVHRILVTSTSEVYGTAKYVPIDEKHPLQGQSPYSASKIGADKFAESYVRSFDVPVTIVRPFNTYGPRQSARAIIPTIITQLLNGEKKIKLGNVTPTRDLVFVKDTVKGFHEIEISKKTIGEEINIATESEISIGDLAKKIIKKINKEAVLVQDNQRFRPKNSEVERLMGSNSKIKSLTNWKPTCSIEEGLDITIKWFEKHENLSKYKHQIYNV